ncbi:MAG: YbaB/EbfC family nucleoid-associated protein [Treponema sp.]|nr:YbaB/EbfC family nucleoid-associated protein [Treponema sp.]MCL2251788.1 YbaB/EbfC family nucleoid-associated protein [Treponema sp.]
MNINPFDILKNAQKMQEQMGNIQEKMASIIETGAAGGGLVEIDLNGKMELIAVRIAPQAVEGAQTGFADTEFLQDLILSAFNDGMNKVKERIGSEFGAMAGLNLPGFPGMQ